MGKCKLSSAVVEDNIQKEEKEISVISHIRQLVNARRIANAKSEFIELATKVDKEFTTDKFNQYKTDLHNFTVVYTRPSDEEHAKGLSEVQHNWNTILPYGKRWFTRRQSIVDVLSVAKSYYSYESYVDNKDKALKQEAKREIENLSKDELINLLKQLRKQE